MKIYAKPWRAFGIVVDEVVIERFLGRVKRKSISVFKAGMKGGHSGRFYKKRGKERQASAPDEFPANQSGALMASISGDVKKRQVKVGSNTPYAGFLADGTSKMKKRRMSGDAMQEGVKDARPIGEFVKFKRI